MIYGIIYKITNKINNKVYIGLTTKHDNPYERVRAHFKKVKSKDLVYDACKKYGKENLEWEVIASASSKDNLDFLEKYFINYFNSLVPNGYNIQLGGNSGNKFSEDTLKLMSLKIKEHYKNNKHPFKGKKFSEKHIKNLSVVRKGFDSEARKAVRKKTHEQACIPIIAINITTNEILEFKSIREAANRLNLQGCNISRVLNKKQNRSQHKGWKFEKKERN